jgi:hypothetical protein
MAFQIRFETETGATYITEKGPFLVMYHPLVLIPVETMCIPDNVSESKKHKQAMTKNIRPGQATKVSTICPCNRVRQRCHGACCI